MGGSKRGNFGNTYGASLDALSNFLTAVSLIPGVDTIADLLAIPVDLARGDFASAGLDALGVLPFVGEIADTAKIAKVADKAVDAAKVVNKATDVAKGTKKISLPDKPAQIKHIFGNRTGHLPDTPSNRKLLTETANTPKYYQGTDKYGNDWHAKIDNKGRQVWVRSRNGKINEGGRNNTPRLWDKETGLNNNPFRTK